MNPFSPELLDQLRKLGSCSVSNAIETFDVRLRNRGFADSDVRCVFDDLPPLVGYAATLRVRTSDPPMEGEGYFYRLDWLDHVLSIPSPRVLVIQDMDRHPGLGAFVGEVHASILAAIDCVGLVTNGAVRDLEEVHALRFQMFASHASVSHAFAHVVDFGATVDVGHMQVHPGDLIHGDRNGVQTIPLEVAASIPEIARKRMTEEQEIIELCRSDKFSIDRLRADVTALRAKRKASKK